MDLLDRELYHWSRESHSDEEIIEVLKVLEKKKSETLKGLEQIRDHERDEVIALKERLKLLRGEEKGKGSSSDPSTSDKPVEKAHTDLYLARSSALRIPVHQETKNLGGTVCREDSELLINVIKAVFEFVRDEKQTQILKIGELLNVSKQEEEYIVNLQRTLGYNIVKDLLERFPGEIWPKIVVKSSSVPYLGQVNNELTTEMTEFVRACMKLVWLMLTDKEPLEFCWEFSKEYYRVLEGGTFDANVRMIKPAIVIRQNNGKLAKWCEGLLQSEATL